MVPDSITLTTDFGTESPYVAAMKGVILSLHPSASIIDLSHTIPPQNIRHTGFFLAEALPYFSAGPLHVVVVDPGVGSNRAILHVVLGNHQLLVPDNGCWTFLARKLAQPCIVRRVENDRLFRPQISQTFHGRDIFAPVAGHLCLGVPPGELGPLVTKWKDLEWPEPHPSEKGITGEIVFVDHFGNLISNLQAESIAPALNQGGTVYLDNFPVERRVQTYAEASEGDIVYLIGSGGFLEVAEVNGNAARKLDRKAGAKIRVEWSQ